MTKLEGNDVRVLLYCRCMSNNAETSTKYWEAWTECLPITIGEAQLLAIVHGDAAHENGDDPCVIDAR